MKNNLITAIAVIAIAAASTFATKISEARLQIVYVAAKQFTTNPN